MHTTPAKFFYVVLAITAVTLSALHTAKSTIAQQTSSATPPAPAAAQSDPSGVMFFPQDQVARGLSKSTTLYNGVPGRNYRVDVFHRDGPGEAEIHAKDTDVFYIVEGSGVFVTGGTVTAARNTAADEVRATSMSGGVSRTLAKGDVIIIPAGVSHWFKEVSKDITYFTVKIR